ncbi:MAG: energy transducer TonB [Marinilabiliaceae bacterium]|nr:energy transducer TonB [Marinilabiliaceae bacterium]
MEAKKSNKANLENKRFLFFQIGLILALGGALAAFEFSETFKVENDWREPVYNMSLLDQEMLPVTFRKQEAKLKPKKIQQLINFEIVEEIFELNEDLELTTEPVTPDNSLLTDFADELVEEDGDPQPFIMVEDKPEFPGGMKALQRFIIEHVRYPIICQEMNIEGTVYVRFIIDKKGSVTGIELVKGVDRNLDKEALRVIAMMPKWKPGRQRDQPVKVSFQMPVKFNLSN